MRCLQFLLIILLLGCTDQSSPNLKPEKADSVKTAATAQKDSATAQKDSAKDQEPPKKAVEQPINQKKPNVYMGRQIAWTMHSSAANWLIRSNREKEESTEEMIKALQLKPGMNVADVGCGNGYHSLMMAKLIGDKGTAYCVDIQQKMLDLLKKRAAELNIKNYETILGEYTDPKLPKNKVDVILLVDAYHEFTDPEAMLKKMRDSLTEKGVLVLIEFRKEDPKVPIKEDHKMSKKQISKELTANGFKLVRSYDKLPWQHFMAFGKDDSKSKEK